MSDEKKYANVSWTKHDVLTVTSDLTEAEAEDFLERNSKYIQEAMAERGWAAIGDLLDYEIAAQDS